MKSTRMDLQGGQTDILVFNTGDELMKLLTAYAVQNYISAARFTAVGAFERVTLQYFDWERKKYIDIPVEEQVEALSLTGDIAMDNGEPKVHAHVVVGKRDGTAHGGHVKEAIVRPTLELVLDRSPSALRKRFDPESGLTLIDVDTSRPASLSSML